MKKKGILILLLSFILFFNNSIVFSDDFIENEPFVDTISNISVDLTAGPPKIDARAGIVMDMKSGRILYEKGAFIKQPMASTTKIMTAIVALENGNLTDHVIVSKRAAAVSGSTIHLKTGEKLSLKEMLYGLMLNSGNDAAMAIAEHIGGSVEEFAVLMNNKATELGAMDTHFVTPHGLDADGHYTTPYDLANITRYALSNPTFSQIVSTKKITINSRTFYSTNEMLGLYEGADGVKTGYTGKAGRCLVTSATRNNERYISIVLGAASRTIRAASSKKILDYAFGSYKTTTLLKSDTLIESIPVKKGTQKSVWVGTSEEISMPLRDDEISAIETKVNMPVSLDAPVNRNVEVGEIIYLLNGKVIARCMIKTKEDIQRKLFWDYFSDIIKCWMGVIKR